LKPEYIKRFEKYLSSIFMDFSRLEANLRFEIYKLKIGARL
jgi:hypothetical protein